MLTPDQAIDRIHERFGAHPGHRALHAKGTLCTGTFTATADAATLCRAVHLQGDPVPATVRLSNGSGHPRHPDYFPDVRGLGVKLYLPDGARTDIVAQSAPRFPNATVEGFFELLRASHPGPAALWHLPSYVARHPHALTGLPMNAAALRPPRSYAACRFFAVHAYRWVDADGNGRFVRYTFVPEVDERPLLPWTALLRGRDYLQDDLRERLASGPIRFTLRVQIADEGDDVDDPSSVWPLSRPTVDVGVLQITGLDTERETGGDVVVFDPTRVTDGIELSDDPVLQFRSAAYSASVAHRMDT